MAENKTSTNKRANWGKLGGSGKMHSFSGAGTQQPGGSSQEGRGSRRGMEPQAGPSNVMGFSKNEAKNSRGAGPQAPGQSHQEGGRQEGFAHGGKHSMFGNRGSRPAQGGKSAPE